MAHSLQGGILADVTGNTVGIDWTDAFSDDVSPLVFFYAIGTSERRGGWDIQDWCVAR
jgi:hypothetical protein